jgi:hypothetical protein
MFGRIQGFSPLLSSAMISTPNIVGVIWRRR